MGSKDVIITKAYSAPGRGAGSKPGDLDIIKEEGTIMITTRNGTLCIERLKPAGKSEMSTAAFLAGNKI